MCVQRGDDSSMKQGGDVHESARDRPTELTRTDIGCEKMRLIIDGWEGVTDNELT